MGLPPLQFLVSGANGNEQTLTVTSWAYIFETVDTESLARQDAQDNRSVRALATGKKVCEPAIAGSDFVAEPGKQSWLFGMPLFYQYTVNYDLAANPPMMSFGDEPCASCGDGYNFLARDEFSKLTPRR